MSNIFSLVIKSTLLRISFRVSKVSQVVFCAQIMNFCNWKKTFITKLFGVVWQDNQKTPKNPVRTLKPSSVLKMALSATICIADNRRWRCLLPRCNLNRILFDLTRQKHQWNKRVWQRKYSSVEKLEDKVTKWCKNITFIKRVNLRPTAKTFYC